MSDDWYTESVRLTFFDVTDWTQRQIFSEISRIAPTQINAQPPMQVYQETGNLADAFLSVAQQGTRRRNRLAFKYWNVTPATRIIALDEPPSAHLVE